MAKKAFVGPLVPDAQTLVSLAFSTFVVIDNTDEVQELPGGGVMVQLSVPIHYADSSLVLKNRVKDVIHEAYEDNSIQIVFINGIGGLLNIL